MEHQSLTQTIIKSKELFQQKMFECENESGDSLMCSINEAFTEFHSRGHNCLGCNLQEDVDLIRNFLEGANNFRHLPHVFRIYVMLLYLLCEKIFEIKKIIGLPQGYKEKDFEIFRTIKIWANFYKHPKAFILTHHPIYYFETDAQTAKLRLDKSVKIIDIEFLKKYYKGEDANKYKNLISELRNNSNVKVIVPPLDTLTKDFCNACAVFIDIIKENKAYKEILNDYSTLESYFENQYRVDSEPY